MCLFECRKSSVLFTCLFFRVRSRVCYYHSQSHGKVYGVSVQSCTQACWPHLSTPSQRMPSTLWDVTRIDYNRYTPTCCFVYFCTESFHGLWGYFQEQSNLQNKKPSGLNYYCLILIDVHRLWCFCKQDMKSCQIYSSLLCHGALQMLK